MAKTLAFNYVIDDKDFYKKLKAHFDKIGVGAENESSVDFKARQKIGLALLGFTVNGSPVEKVVPPIMWGILRGSGTVFVGSKRIGDSKMTAGRGEGTPCESHSAPAGVITVGFNTSYAERLHETEWKPGGVIPSKQAADNPEILRDVGNKFLEKHLQADRDILIKAYAIILRKAFEGK